MIEEIPAYWFWVTHWPFIQLVSPLRAVAGSSWPPAMAEMAACSHDENDENTGRPDTLPAAWPPGIPIPPDRGVAMVVPLDFRLRSKRNTRNAPTPTAPYPHTGRGPTFLPMPVLAFASAIRD